MARSRSRTLQANRNFDDGHAARAYRLRAAGLQPGDPVDASRPFTPEFSTEFALA